jgi:hypothetical protein
MKIFTIYLLIAICFVECMPQRTEAAVCASGPYKTGCAGPNGAVVVQKTPYYRPPAYYHPPTVTCANGVYHAGCAGPNGAVIVQKNY